MKHHAINFHIGLRTFKTALAVVISMLIVEALGASTSKLIFAMVGAMAALQPTFKESIESSLAQIIGVIFGAIIGVALLMLKFPPLIITAVGIIMVITLYNTLRIRFSPTLPCFIVVMLATTPGIMPISYAAGRVWDTTIGLAVGLLINTLVFPYDNRKKMQSTAASLDKELIAFLEDMFDGDEKLPDSNDIQNTIDSFAQQLKTFSNQKLLTKLRRQKEDLIKYNAYQQKARALVAQMEVLCAMKQPGKLNAENRQALIICGANITDLQASNCSTELDIITNYHVSQILSLRKELLIILENMYSY